MSANTELTSKQKRRINKRAAAKIIGINDNALELSNEVVVSNPVANTNNDYKKETNTNNDYKKDTNANNDFQKQSKKIIKMSTVALSDECADIIRKHHSELTLNSDCDPTKKQSNLEQKSTNANTNKGHGKGDNNDNHNNHSNGGSSSSSRRSTWNFAVDYNDHFETPLVAYTDILPMLLTLAKALNKKPEELVIYDPYYCQGGMVAMLAGMGFPKVINMNRDFYADVAMKRIPDYDILITNPPYSGEHKPKLLKYLLNSTSRQSSKDQLKGSNCYKGKPFALLLPAYTATKSYWKEFVTDLDCKFEVMKKNVENEYENSSVSSRSHKAVLYLLPPESYEYRHPEGTGKDTPPFFSAWFLGGFTDTNISPIDSSTYVHASSSSSSSSGSGSSPINNSITGESSTFVRANSSSDSGISSDITDSVRTALLRRPITTSRDSSFRVLTSIDDLVATGIITDKRPNPKNRKKMSKQRAVINSSSTGIENKQMVNKKKLFESDDLGVKKKKRY